ncbi:MAG: hypothetical protein ABEJ89_00605 [Haloarculaceae archaeon]
MSTVLHAVAGPRGLPHLLGDLFVDAAFGVVIALVVFGLYYEYVLQRAGDRSESGDRNGEGA